MICAWIDTSSADTGSSQTISFGLQRQRPGDADALALAAGELGREPVVVLRVEPDAAPSAPARWRLRSAPPPMPWMANGSPMIEPDPPARVQRAVRVLEDHLHVAAQRPQLARGRAA